MAGKNKTELINGYLSRIMNSSNKIGELQKVLDEIDTLVYSETQKPISDEYKNEIIKGIRDRLQPLVVEQRDFSEKIQKSGRVYNATDNSEIVDIINAVEARLKGKWKW